MSELKRVSIEIEYGDKVWTGSYFFDDSLTSLSDDEVLLKALESFKEKIEKDSKS